jgi:hypothetical protein
MEMKNFKWPFALLIFVLAFALIAGGIIIRQRNFINDPLLRRLNDIGEVKNAHLAKDGGIHTITVDLEDVSDFAALYIVIDEMAASVLGRGNYRIEFSDNRDETLIEAYSIAHLALYEAQRRGNFTEMAKYVKAIMESFNITEHHIAVDSDRIYFSAQNDEHYLYEVVYKQSEQKGEVSFYDA